MYFFNPQHLRLIIPLTHRQRRALTSAGTRGRGRASRRRRLGAPGPGGHTGGSAAGGALGGLFLVFAEDGRPVGFTERGALTWLRVVAHTLKPGSACPQGNGP